MYRCEVPHKPDKCCINFIYCSFVNLIFFLIFFSNNFPYREVWRPRAVQAPSELCDFYQSRRLIDYQWCTIECKSYSLTWYNITKPLAIALLSWPWLLEMWWRLAVKSYSWLRYCHSRAVSAIASRPQSPHLCLNVALELHLWMDHNEEYLALKYALLITTCKSLQIRPYVFAIKTTSWECRSVLFFSLSPLTPPNSTVNWQSSFFF